MTAAATTRSPDPAPPAWRRWMRAFGRAGLDLVYPAHCPACGVGTVEPGALCGPCWAGMPFITRPYCERLGTPFAFDIGGPLLSPQAIADPPAFDRARAVALHDGDAKGFVHRLKYSDRLDLARPMGRMMAAACAEVLDGADLLVPVPLHWTRHLWRRFNQSALLAEEVSQACGVPVATDVVKRKKRTQPQIGMTRAQRIANLQGAFAVPPEARPTVEGRHCVLVDDVHTTGATLNACAHVLRRAGARQIDVVTFTKVADPLANTI
jgi:ComF family protein